MVKLLVYLLHQLPWLSLVLMFQSLPSPIHCFSASRKWTPKSTFNKKSQDCTVMLHPVKKQAIRHLKLQPVFLWKHVYAFLASISLVVSLCNVVSEVFEQHWPDNIFLQYCPRMSDTVSIGYILHIFSSQTLSVSHEPTLHR